MSTSLKGLTRKKSQCQSSLSFSTEVSCLPKSTKFTNMFYISTTVEIFKKSGPAQCFLCQRFDHSSNNCHHLLRCVKYSGQHLVQECLKQPDQALTCCNCSGDHPANFPRCPYYQRVFQVTYPSRPVGKPITPRNNIVITISSSHSKLKFSYFTVKKLRRCYQ